MQRTGIQMHILYVNQNDYAFIQNIISSYDRDIIVM